MTNRNLIKELVREGYADMEEGNDVEDSLNVFAVVALFEEILSRLNSIEQRLDSL
jgi:hypothetical protein